ncbi:hypothetical protein [Bacillus sp. FJAT-29937]|uniref:hypothetical protein n=1 Tax=Bacillus sp. FJAT-29937 TaxID=1720553 RepID=UPI000A6FFDB0|nr:hypothetical protein [Bacillus sp. FJAT-29937]
MRTINDGMSISDIKFFIEKRLELAKGAHIKGKKDFSNSISCYEFDLQKLFNYSQWS